MLNMLEFGYMYLNKQSSKYARILNVSDAVHSRRSPYKLLSTYSNRDIFRTLPSALSAGMHHKFFRAEEVLWNEDTLINISSKT